MKKKKSQAAGKRTAARASTSSRPKPRTPRAKRDVSAAEHGASGGGSRKDPAATALLRELDHPLAREIEATRELILGVSPKITEAVKWNAPSFRTADFFATIHVRNHDAVQIVFHTGVKVKQRTKDLEIADPRGLVKWLAKDRCLVTLGAGREFAANRPAFRAIVRAWIGQL